MKFLSFLLLISISTYGAGNFEFSFSPSPKSIDYHMMFDSEHQEKWSGVAANVSYFNFHPLSFYRMLGPPLSSFNSHLLKASNNAYYTGAEALKAAQTIRDNGLEASVTVSHSLGYGRACNPFSDATKAGVLAAGFDYNQLATVRTSLSLKGKSIKRIYVDGPFLRTMINSKKEHSCATFNHNGLKNAALSNGRNPYGNNGAIKVVHEYFKELRRLFPNAQLFLALNIVNWKQGTIAPHWGNDEFDLYKIMHEYLTEYYKNGTNGYRLSGFQFDAPYSVIGVNAASRSTYNDRLSLFYTQLESSLGSTVLNNMKFSFLVNTIPIYNFDKHPGTRFFPFRQSPAESSDVADKNAPLKSESELCGEIANLTTRAKCLESDARYYRDTKHYGNYLTHTLKNHTVLKRMRNVNFSYTSWHASPRESVVGSDSYIDFVQEEIGRLQPKL